MAPPPRGMRRARVPCRRERYRRIGGRWGPAGSTLGSGDAPEVQYDPGQGDRPYTAKGTSAPRQTAFRGGRPLYGSSPCHLRTDRVVDRFRQ
ncbi:hypothetical protein GCM10009830_33420 [Glycomyces endophyticus]|uniref:Uncharacterized protein n=1 Tax=Glycomyces endophyticus TaxID=480996 RepID=A0ABP4T7J3_9ACTN